MKVYEIIVENTNNVLEQIKDKIDEVAFNSVDEDYKISLIINTLSIKDNKILEVYEQFVFSDIDYKILSIKYNLINDEEIIRIDTDPYVMILGNVNENMTIMSPINVKIIGEANGNIVLSDDKCYVYANKFVDANVIFNSSLKHIADKEDLKVFSK